MGRVRAWVNQVIDIIVARIARAHPRIKPALSLIVRPLVVWRIQAWGRALADFRKLPPVHWVHVKKHGLNVVYQSEVSDDSGTLIQGLWVVDYMNRTRRVVFSVPEEYVHIGKTF